MRVLFLSRWFPYPIENGAKIRIYNLLKGLSAQHTVDLLSFYEGENVEAGVEFLRDALGEVKVVRYRPFKPNSAKSIVGFISRQPRSVIDTYHPEFAARVEELTSKNRYDLVIASEIDMAIYGLKIKGVKKVLEELEVTKILTPYRQETNLLKKLRGGLTWWKLSGYVRGLLKEYDGCTVVSEQEEKALADIYPGKKPAVIPNGVDCAYYRQECDTEPEPDTLIFNGSITYSVNFEAAAYFIHQILPLIQARRPQVRLLITGKVTPALIQVLPKNEGVIFTGFLDDIRPTLFRAWANVVPLTIGGGTRLKILEAMAAGLPVISTSIGAEGLEVEPGRDLLLADRPEAFARAVLEVLGSSALRNQLAQNGRRAVETRYDWGTINQAFHNYLHQVMQA